MKFTIVGYDTFLTVDFEDGKRAVYFREDWLKVIENYVEQILN